jgi:hypothetical protein
MPGQQYRQQNRQQQKAPAARSHTKDAHHVTPFPIRIGLIVAEKKAAVFSFSGDRWLIFQISKLPLQNQLSLFHNRLFWNRLNWYKKMQSPAFARIYLSGFWRYSAARG